MNLVSAFFRPWRNLSITAKFALAFGLFLGMVIL